MVLRQKSKHLTEKDLPKAEEILEKLFETYTDCYSGRIASNEIGTVTKRILELAGESFKMNRDDVTKYIRLVTTVYCQNYYPQDSLISMILNELPFVKPFPASSLKFDVNHSPDKIPVRYSKHTERNNRLHDRHDMSGYKKNPPKFSGVSSHTSDEDKDIVYSTPEEIAERKQKLEDLFTLRALGLVFDSVRKLDGFNTNEDIPVINNSVVWVVAKYRNIKTVDVKRCINNAITTRKRCQYTSNAEELRILARMPIVINPTSGSYTFDSNHIPNLKPFYLDAVHAREIFSTLEAKRRDEWFKSREAVLARVNETKIETVVDITPALPEVQKTDEGDGKVVDLELVKSLRARIAQLEKQVEELTQENVELKDARIAALESVQDQVANMLTVLRAVDEVAVAEVK